MDEISSIKNNEAIKIERIKLKAINNRDPAQLFQI